MSLLVPLLEFNQEKSSGRIAGVGRLKEVVARKALKGGGDSEKREAEKNQISAEVLF